jgi:D-lyxose ketol-isomerase
MYHSFWGQRGTGQVMVGEVSAVNDDQSDNRFLEELGRFPEIEEDEAPAYLLCSEYPPAE